MTSKKTTAIAGSDHRELDHKLARARGAAKPGVEQLAQRIEISITFAETAAAAIQDIWRPLPNERTCCVRLDL